MGCGQFHQAIINKGRASLLQKFTNQTVDGLISDCLVRGLDSRLSHIRRLSCIHLSTCDGNGHDRGNSGREESYGENNTREHLGEWL